MINQQDSTNAVLRRAAAWCFVFAIIAMPAMTRAFTFSSLRVGATNGVEDYVFTAGDKVVPVAQIDAGRWYRVVVLDPSGIPVNSMSCVPAANFSTTDNGYTIQPTDPLSTGGAYTFRLEQFVDDTCNGAPLATLTKTFYVVRATAYTDPFLDTTTNRYTSGATAFVRVSGLPSNSLWNVTWILPNNTTGCVNNAGSDRPRSDTLGSFPAPGTGPSDGLFMAYPPDNAATDPWNKASSYEVSGCPVFSESTEGQWRLRLQRDALNFIVLPIFVVSNDCVAPTIRTNPQPAATCLGGNITMSISATGSALSYQWRRAGTNLANDAVISGVTNSTLTLTGARPGDSADYDVVVNGRCGSITSAVATVTVNPPPSCSVTGAAIACANSPGNVFTAPDGMAVYAWSISGNGVIAGSSNAQQVVVTAGATGNFTLTLDLISAAGCGSSCTKTVSVVSASAVVSGDTTNCLGASATLQAVLTGTAPWTLLWSDGFVQSGVNASPVTRVVSPSTTTTYSITNVQDANCSFPGSSSATVTVLQPPTVLQQPANAAACVSNSASFSVAASGSGPISIQWQSSTNGTTFTNIPNATNATYNTAPVTTANLGTLFRAQFSNMCGTAVSTTAVLIVNSPPGCSISGAAVACPNSVSNVFSAPAGMSSYRWSISGNASIAGPTNAQSVTVNAGASNSFTLTLGIVSAAGCSNNCAQVVSIARPSGAVTGGGIVCFGTPATIRATMTGSPPFTVYWSDGFVQTVSSNVAARSVSPATNTTYTVANMLDAYCAGPVAGSATVSNNFAPAVTLNPTNHAVCAGTSVSFTSSASGTPAPRVQWQFTVNGVNFTNIANATNATYTFTPTIADSGKQYRASFSNSCGVVTSAAATLSVQAAPSVAILSDASLCVGSTGNLASVSNAPAGATYGWTISNGTITSGQGTSGITFNVTNNATVVLTVNVTNSSGCAATATKNVPIATPGGMSAALWSDTRSAWTVGNMNNADQDYSEGSVVPMRVVFSSLCGGAQWCVTITWDYAQSAAHFMDSLSTYDKNVTLVDGFECTNTVCGARTTYPIPTDPTLPAGAQLPGSFVVYNGSITNVSAYSSNSSTRSITIYGVTESGGGVKDVVLLVGGHLARENEWGTGRGARSVPGGSQGVSFSSTCNGGANTVKMNPSDLVPKADVLVIGSAAPSPVCVSNTLLLTLRVTNFGPEQASGVVVTDALPAGLIFQSATVSQGTFTGTSNLSFSLGSLAAGTNATIQITALVSNAAGAFLTNIARVTNSSPPDLNPNNNATTNIIAVNRHIAFSLQPSGATLCPGAPMSFSVNATGSTFITYQWFKGASAIAGATNSTFEIPAVTLADGGNYTAVATGPCNNATSAVAALVVRSYVAASTPYSLALCPGQNAAFSTTPSGTGPFTFVWRKDGVVIPGATTSTLVVSNVVVADAGTYSVEVTGPCNSVTNSATLAVDRPSATPLANVTTCEGVSAGFSTTPSGQGPFSFVWRHDSVLIPGATNNFFIITNVTATNAGAYAVEVTGACGSVTNFATLSITTNATTSPLANLTNCSGSTATFSTTPQGSGPFTYVWRKGSNAIAGATNSTLVLSNVTTESAGIYSVEVTTSCGLATSTGTLTVNETTTVAGLANLTRCEGAPVSFTAVPGGTPPFTYAWRKDGTLLPNETNATLTIASVNTNSAGNYMVEVTGACGVATANATLAVNPLASGGELSPAVVCEGATAVFATAPGGAGPFQFVWRKDGALLANETNSVLVITNAATTNAGLYAVEITGGCNSITNVATLTVHSLPQMAAIPDARVCPGGSGTFAAVVTATPPIAYSWFHDGILIPEVTNSSLTVSNITVAEAGLYTVIANCSCGNVTNSASLIVNEPVALTPLADQRHCAGDTAFFAAGVSGTGPFTFVWRKDGFALPDETNSSLTISNVSPAAAGIYTVEVTGVCGTATNSAQLFLNDATAASALTSLTRCVGDTAVFSTTPSGTGPFTFVWRKDGVALADATNNSLTVPVFSAIDGGVYSVEVRGACNTVTNSATLAVNQLTSASQPASLSRCVGENATFTTTPAGTGPFVFAWRKNGTLIPGATNASLVIAPVTVFDAGTYSVEVSGPCNSVTNTATLAVNAATAATPLNDLAVCVGAPAQFATTPGGTGPFVFAWRKVLANGQSVLLTNETNSTLTIAAVSVTDAGIYSVEVSGACNSVTNSARLTVNTPPAISGFISQTVCAGAVVTFAPVISGTGPLAYQWRKDGTALSGGTNASYTISPAAPSHSGTYSLEVSGLCGSTTNFATLTVNALTAAAGPVNTTNCAGTTATLTAAPSGAGPFAFTWRRNSVVISGETNASLVINGVTAAQAGNYSVEVRGACNSVTNSAVLVVFTNTVLTPLQNQSACAGNSVTFATTPSGVGPFSFVWRRGGTLLAGRTNNSITLTNLSAGDAGVYSVEVTGACGSATNSATLSVGAAPVIALTNQTRCVGETAFIVANVTPPESGPFSYVWRRSGFAIGGANSNTLVVTPVNNTKAGAYTVEVTGLCRNATNSMQLFVRTNLSISGITNQVRCERTTVTFAANVFGTGPFAFQWKKDGVVLSNRTNATLVLSNVTVSDSALYTLEAVGACNAVTNSARLTVNLGTTATPLTSMNVCEGTSVTFSTIATGMPPLSFVWRRNGVILVGQTNSSLVFTSVLEGHSGNYSVVVSGGCGSITNTATLNVSGFVRATMETNITICGCEDSIIAPVVTGAGPMTYRWYHEGILMEDQTNSFLNLHRANLATPGLYRVEIDGACGSHATNETLVEVNRGGNGFWSNPGAINIPEFGAVDPYPSSIEIRCAPPNISQIHVTLYGISHQYPDDLDIMLVGPQGHAVVLMSDCGGAGIHELNNITLSFSDDATIPLPDSALITNGVYKPTNYGPEEDDVYGSPAPPEPNTASLASFLGTNPNGVWRLFVVDDSGLDWGVVAGGWSLDFGTKDYLDQQLKLAGPVVTNGVFKAKLFGTPGKTYFIEGSTDFQRWTVVSTNLLSTTPMTISDTNAVYQQYRFYRASGCRDD